MSPAAVFLLSISMSADSFAVSVGRGTLSCRAKLLEVAKTGAVFAVVQALTPMIGWLIGSTAAGWVSRYDHWIAFGLLAIVGLHMVYEALTADEAAAPQETQMTSRWMLLATAFGTSIDAMAIGLSLALINFSFPNIVGLSLAIGLATFVMSSAGLLVGKVIGDKFGKYAVVVAGFVLLGLGCLILWQHLMA